jgi:hypothetical protein
MSTKSVLDHHLAAFGAGDVDATMADDAEESVMIGTQGTSRGLNEIRATFERIYGTVFVLGEYEFTLDSEHIEGEIAYITWHASTPTLDVPFASDTYVIRDEVIVAQTVALHAVPK